MKFGLTDKQFQSLYQLVVSPLKGLGATVWIFGSRARGDHKPFSDVDILFEIPIDLSLPNGFLSGLRESIEESRFPFKVDIVNSEELADSYRSGVFQDRVRIE